MINHQECYVYKLHYYVLPVTCYKKEQSEYTDSNRDQNNAVFCHETPTSPQLPDLRNSSSIVITHPTSVIYNMFRNYFVT